MDPITIGLLMGGSALVSGLGSVFGSQAAASAQRSAAGTAAQTQLTMFQKILDQMMPFITAGQGAIPGLQGALGGFGGAIGGATDVIGKFLSQLGYGPGGTAGGNPLLMGPTPELQPITEEQAKAAPGFAFAETQGLKDIQSGYAAKGLGSSGAAMKGAGQFETGLATTMIPSWMNFLMGQQQQQFTQNMANREELLKILTGGVSTAMAEPAMYQNLVDAYQRMVSGGTVAGQITGTAGTAAGQGVSAAQLGAGQATAAADISTGTALGGIPQNAIGAYTQYSLLNALTNAYGKVGAPAPGGGAPATTPVAAAASPFPNVGGASPVPYASYDPSNPLGSFTGA